MNYDEQIAALQAQIKELEAKRDGISPWMPEKGEDYFAFITDFDGTLKVEAHTNLDAETIVNQSQDLGIFKTKLEAENRLKQIRAITKWQSIPNDFVPDWGKQDQNKWHPRYLHDERKIGVDYFWTTEPFPFQHFASKEQCQRAIDWMGEESMRHLFGIFGD